MPGRRYTVRPASCSPSSRQEPPLPFALCFRFWQDIVRDLSSADQPWHSWPYIASWIAVQSLFYWGIRCILRLLPQHSKILAFWHGAGVSGRRRWALRNAGRTTSHCVRIWTFRPRIVLCDISYTVPFLMSFSSKVLLVLWRVGRGGA